MHEARFTYCRHLYAREFEIKERLEAKAAVVFTFVGAFVGAAFLDGDAVEEVARVLAAGGGLGLVSGTLLAGVTAGLLAASSFAIAVLLVQTYRKEVPRETYAFLFAPGAGHLASAEALYEELGGRLALATEHNAAVNDRKAEHLRRAIVALLAAVVLLLLFTGLYLLTGNPASPP